MDRFIEKLKSVAKCENCPKWQFNLFNLAVYALGLGFCALAVYVLHLIFIN